MTDDTIEVPTDDVEYGIEYLEGWANSPVTDAETAERLRRSVDAMKALVKRDAEREDDYELGERGDPDIVKLAWLIDHAEWEDIGYGVQRARLPKMDDHFPIQTALNWECETCRPDVGWNKHESIERTIEQDGTAKITGIPIVSKPEFHVQCGHCGTTWYYDELGDELGGEG